MKCFNHPSPLFTIALLLSAILKFNMTYFDYDFKLSISMVMVINTLFIIIYEFMTKSFMFNPTRTRSKD